MERISTFANIGTDINRKASLGLPEEMKFTVRKEPLGWYDSMGGFHRVKGESTVVREDNLKSYGAVSDNYCAIDNDTALGSLQYIDDMNIVKYGETNTGMQYVIGKLPSIKILGDDFTPYLIYRNSFNGRYPVQVAICPLRIVCQNQFNIAFKEADNMFSLRHTVKASERLEEAHKVMLKSADYLSTLSAKAEQFANMKVSPFGVERIISELFPIKDSMTDRQKETIKQKIAFFRNCLNADDNANFKGTVWGLINSYTDFVTHETPVRQTETGAENKFMAVTFDARIMSKFLSIAQAVA